MFGALAHALCLALFRSLSVCKANWSVKETTKETVGEKCTSDLSEASAVARLRIDVSCCTG